MSFLSVIDIPSIPYLNTLKTSKRFSKYQYQGEISPEEKIDVIVHFSPQSIIQNEDYQTWMKSFPKEAIHLIMNETNRCDGYAGLEDFQHALRTLSEAFFPRLNQDSLVDDKRLNVIFNQNERKFDDNPNAQEFSDKLNIYPAFTNLLLDITFEKKFDM